MSAAAKAPEFGTGFADLKARLKATWMAGDYDLFSSFMETHAEQFCEELRIRPGTKLLDVGCGAGQLALLAARAGAEVTACDISTNWLDKGRARASAAGLRIRFEEGDAESLPFADARFDLVVSLIAAMFAPRPDRVAAELTRVCRPGGKIVMANWTPGGFVGKMFKIIARYIAPSGMPAPALWGDEETVRDRLRAGVAKLKCTRRIYRFDYPFGPDAVVEFFRVNYGPTARAFASLDDAGQQDLRRDLVRLWSEHNYAIGPSTHVDAEYLEVTALKEQ